MNINLISTESNRVKDPSSSSQYQHERECLVRKQIDLFTIPNFSFGSGEDLSPSGGRILPTEVEELVKKSSLDSSELQRLFDFCIARDEVVVLSAMQWKSQFEQFSDTTPLTPQTIQVADGALWDLGERIKTLREDMEAFKQLSSEEMQVHLPEVMLGTDGIEAGLGFFAEGLRVLEEQQNRSVNFTKEVLSSLNSIEDYEKKSIELQEWFSKNKDETMKLTQLDVSGYGLTSIPDVVFELANLENLELKDNQLTTLPSTIINLTKLAELYLDGNPIVSLPEECKTLFDDHELYFVDIWVET